MGTGGNFGSYLKANHIRVSEVSKKSGVNKNTIYSFIKRDSDRIDVNLFIKICEAVGVKPEMFSENPQQNYVLTDEEKIIIEGYRKLSDEQKDLIRRMIAFDEQRKETPDELKKAKEIAERKDDAKS